MKQIAKSLLPYLVAVVTFIIISVAFSYPGVFQNKTLYQHDIVSGIGGGQEASSYQKETGEKTLWTNSLFGGMPTYQIQPFYPSTGIVANLNKMAGLYLPQPANYIFLYLFGAFLLFMSFGYKKDLKSVWKATLLSMLGAIAYAFSSYFIIIIQAGHIWKVYTLAYIPPTLAGIIWAYRGKYWLGGFVAALYATLQLYSNHPQMTYYMGMFLLIFIVAELIHSIQSKTLSNFFKASAVLLVAGGLAFGVNSTNMYHSAQYSKYTLRGPSELTSVGDQSFKTSGIDLDYATRWSYGIGETFTLLIPNTKGGATGYLGNDASAMKKAPANLKNDIAQQNHYWGDQPGTSGPVYVGAFIMFLFILGLFIVKNRWKWVLLIATVLSILLSWGHNFMWFTELFFKIFPGYDKFRAVSSILIVAELAIPMLAVMTVLEIIKNPQVIKTQKREFYVSIGLTAGLIFLFIIYPYFFRFFSNAELDMFAQGMQNPQSRTIYSQFMDALEAVRVSIFRIDAWRSLLFILIGVGILMLYSAKKVKTVTMLILVSALVLVDLFAVDKRYLNESHFSPKKNVESVIGKSAADDQILQDKDPNFRVFNRTTDSFNESLTSYHHKSVGGYHGAKLRRYQDLIEHHIAKGNMNVFNMLNTKYFIIPGNNNTPQAVRNSGTLGNAWFIDTVKLVNNADEEIDAITSFNPKTVAFADKRFESNIPQNVMVTPYDSAAFIKLTSYAPNKLTYEANVSEEKLAVFSEVYYPDGWHAYIDGNEVPIVRVNYILRALSIPTGKHNIEMVFDPKSYHVTENIATISYIGILIMLLMTIFMQWKQCKKAENENSED